MMECLGEASILQILLYHNGRTLRFQSICVTAHLLRYILYRDTGVVERKCGLLGHREPYGLMKDYIYFGSDQKKSLLSLIYMSLSFYII